MREARNGERRHRFPRNAPFISGFSLILETVVVGNVTQSSSALRNNSAIGNGGDGNSTVVRRDDGKHRRRAHRSTSYRVQSPLACLNLNRRYTSKVAMLV